MIDAERAQLARRLAHRLRSSLLLVGEGAERGDLDLVRAQIGELRARAAALESCCLPWSEPARDLDLAAALGAAVPGAQVPGGLRVRGGERALQALVEALAAWMGDGAAWSAQPDGIGGVLLVVEAGSAPIEAAELGEPLVRLLAGDAGGRVDSWTGQGASVVLVAAD